MDTISSVEMFKALSKYKCITCFHKYININEVIDACKQGYDSNYFMLSTGITDNDFERIKSNIQELKDNNIDVNFICIDVANGYMFKLIDYCKKIREYFPNITLVAGNVVTREMTEELIINGKIDIIKVGIGSGAVCTTRLQTGVGMPQLSAIIECADAAHGLNAHIISDGGICVPGDFSKAYGGGADFVMAGSIFSGHLECPGDIIIENGVDYKLFYGMSSDTAMNKHNGGVAHYRSSEGKTVKIKIKGSINGTISDILGGIRSTCTYIGASRLKDINKCATFLRVNRQVNTYYK
jgi:GMP reductase